MHDNYGMNKLIYATNEGIGSREYSMALYQLRCGMVGAKMVRRLALLFIFAILRQRAAIVQNETLTIRTTGVPHTESVAWRRQE